MIKVDEQSNANSWELEVVCRNKEYLDAVMAAILKFGMMNFEVEVTGCNSNHKGYDGRYTVLVWCSWFHNLSALTKELEAIEKKLN